MFILLVVLFTGGLLFVVVLQSWTRLVGDYQALYKQLEKVENSIPTVGLVEESEDRLTERITLYQVNTNAASTPAPRLRSSVPSLDK